MLDVSAGFPSIKVEHRLRHLVALDERQRNSSAMSMVTSRDQHSLVLKATMRTVGSDRALSQLLARCHTSVFPGMNTVL